MKKRVVLVPHGRPFNHDRASAHLAESGFQVDFRFPCDGDRLGKLTSDVAGTIVFGGKYCIDEIPQHAFLQDEIDWLRKCMDADLPTLGICQGGQMIAHILGAAVGPHPEGLHEFGYYPIHPVGGDDSFLSGELFVPQAHYHTFDVPKGAKLLASSADYPNQAFQWGDHVFAFQFHPEATPEHVQEHWLNQPWGEQSSSKPNAQSREEIERLGKLRDAKLDGWFRRFLTNLFGTAKTSC